MNYTDFLIQLLLVFVIPFLKLVCKLILYFFSWVNFSNSKQLSGRWHVYINDSSQENTDIYPEFPNGTIEIYKSLHLVRADIHLITNSKGKKIDIKWKYKGKLSGDQIILNFEEVSKDSRMVGSTILKVGKRYEEMYGKNLYWDHSESAFGGELFKLVKIKP